MKGSTFKRCGCRDESGKQLGVRCPKLRGRGHGFVVGALRRTSSRGPEAHAAEDRPLPNEGRGRSGAGGVGRPHKQGGAARRPHDHLRRLPSAAARGPRRPKALDCVELHTPHRHLPRAEPGPRAADRLARVRLRGALPRDAASRSDVARAPIANAAAHHRRTEGPAGCRRKPSEATIRRVHATALVALGEAMRREMIARNPGQHVEFGNTDSPRAVVWTPERVAEWKRTGKRHRVAVWTAAQYGQFLDFAAADDLYAMWHLIGMRGLRRGEAVGLSWEDVDLDGV